MAAPYHLPIPGTWTFGPIGVKTDIKISIKNVEERLEAKATPVTRLLLDVHTRTQVGASFACNSAIRQLFKYWPPRIVSAKCTLQESRSSTPIARAFARKLLHQ